jgi:hypothetical protein
MQSVDTTFTKLNTKFSIVNIAVFVTLPETFFTDYFLGVVGGVVLVFGSENF